MINFDIVLGKYFPYFTIGYAIPNVENYRVQNYVFVKLETSKTSLCSVMRNVSSNSSRLTLRQNEKYRSIIRTEQAPVANESIGIFIKKTFIQRQ